MKNTLILVAALFVSGITTSAVAQNRTEVKKEIKSVKKEVRFEENNGKKTLTIETEENGKKTKEVYTGTDADKKMNELNTSHGSVTPRQVEHQKVIVRESVNDKKMTMKSSGSGNITMKHHTGSDGDANVKEMEADPNEIDGKTKRKTKVKKRKKAKSKLIRQEKR